MTLLDGGTIEDAKMEVKEKFVSTWKVFNFLLNPNPHIVLFPFYKHTT